MRPVSQELRKHWAWCGAALSLCLITGAAVLRPGDANAALEPLPTQLARALSLDPREARAQLPDGRWLVLDRGGETLKLIEDRDNGAVLHRWPLASPRRLASLSLLPSGRVLIWGGVDARNRPQPAGLWFDPNSRTLTPTVGLNLSPRAGHAATVLSDGRLLITGGWMPGANGVAKAELWDERAASASLAEGVLAPARLGHRSRLEADGRVRLSDGVDGQGRKLADDQMYDPTRQSFAATPALAAAQASNAAPRLVASAPRTQSRNVATDARLSLRFSEPLRAAELDGASVTLLGPGGFAAVQVTPAEAGRLLFVTPRRRMQANSAYSLLVDGAHGRNGKPLATTLIDFETAPDQADTKSNPDRRSAAQPSSSKIATTAAASIKPTQKAVANAAPAAIAAAQAITVNVDGSSGTLSTSNPDEPGIVHFNLGANGNYGLGIGPLQTPGSTEPATLTLRRSGVIVATVPCSAAYDGCAVNASQAGSYTAELKPPAGATLNLTATLSRDRTATLQLNSGQVNVGLTRRGQNMRVTFNASASTTDQGIRISNQRVAPLGREVSYTLYAPNGSVVATRMASATDALVGPFAPVTGTYTLLVEPRYGETATLTVSGGASNQVAVDGAPRVRVNTPMSGILTMDLDGGANLGLGLGGLSGADARLTITLTRASGEATPIPLQPCFTADGGCELDIAGLPAGMYIARIGASSGSGAVSYNAYLSSDKSVELTAAHPLTLNLDRPGQNGRISFDLDPAQTRALNISAVSTSPTQRAIAYTLYPPSGSPQAPVTVVGATQLPLLNLPAGRYSLQVDPQLGATASARFELSAEVGTVQVGGAPVDLSSQTAGEKLKFSFANHRASADIGLGLSALSIAGSAQPPTVTVKRADGGSVSSLTCPALPQQEGCDLDLPALAQGLYNVEVAPPAGATALQFRATVSEDAVATLQREQPLELNLARRGQNATVSFQAQAGETVNLSVRDQLTDPAGKLVAYTIRKPDGGMLASQSVGANGVGGISLGNLPATGTYTVFVDPEQAAAMTARLAFIDDFSADLVADGEPRTVRTALTHQVLYLNFQAEQGANLGLGFDQFEGIPALFDGLSITVNKAGGGIVGSSSCQGRMLGCAIDLPKMDAGSYTVKIVPQGLTGGYGLRATLSSDQEHSLALAQPTQASIDRWGQNARYRFQASQGQSLTLAITDHSHASQPPGPLPEHTFSYFVYGPDGRAISRGESEGGVFLRFDELEASGEYTLLIDPMQGDTMTAQVQLNLNENLGHLLVDGAPLRMATQFPGQPLMFTFDVDSQPQLYLSIVAAVPSAKPGYELRIERDGATIVEMECYPNNLGCSLPLEGLAPGRYYAALANVADNGPPHYAIDAILSTPRTGALILGQPMPLQLRSGQPGSLSFSGTAGQRLTLKVSGKTSVPANATIDYVVRTPSGSVLDFNASAAAAFNANLPALPVDGDYTLRVSKANGVSVDVQVQLDPTP